MELSVLRSNADVSKKEMELAAEEYAIFCKTTLDMQVVRPLSVLVRVKVDAE